MFARPTIRIVPWLVVPLVVAALTSSPAHAAESYRLLKKADYAVTDAGPLSLDVLAPTGKANGLGIIDVARGAGYSPRGSVSDAEVAQIADGFCSRGYTVFVVHPGPSSKFSVLDMADHVGQAIVYLKDHSDEYGVDPDRLGLVSTAGGIHLVALVSITASEKTAVKAAGVYLPPTDFREKGAQDLYIQANNAAWEQIKKSAFGGGSFADTGTAATVTNQRDPRIKLPQVSPKAPTLLIIHGDADPIAPTGRTSTLFTAMREANRATDMVVKRPGSDPERTVRAEVKTLADWFDKRLAAE
jgi:acetyl esterase/lipase